jgi:Asp-tRNA(Asn)/Glu-tRNA(Gln) amidotransferase A subunit family amidase
MIYHTRPGKGPALESLFHDAAKVISDHGMEVVGYWVPEGDPAWADTFVYLVAHPSMDDAKQRWDAIHNDPAMRVYIKEAADNIIERVDKRYNVDEVYMRPTDFSVMK